MSINTIQYCGRCGQAFREGQTRYLVTIHLTADFDGTISGPGNPGELQSLWKEIAKKSEEELTNEVAQTLSFMICKPCRDEWVQSPLGQSLEAVEESAGQVH